MIFKRRPKKPWNLWTPQNWKIIKTHPKCTGKHGCVGPTAVWGGGVGPWTFWVCVYNLPQKLSFSHFPAVSSPLVSLSRMCKRSIGRFRVRVLFDFDDQNSPISNRIGGREGSLLIPLISLCFCSGRFFIIFIIFSVDL